MSKEFFEEKIMPFFYQYREQMLWRMDIASYEDVKANAPLICGRIDPTIAGDNRMPPPPYPAFDAEVINNFKIWMEQEGISFSGPDGSPCCMGPDTGSGS